MVAVGEDAAGAPASVDTWFDLASLTKVLVTVPLVLGCMRQGLLDPDAPLEDLLPDVGWTWMPPTGTLARATPMSLLCHASGAAPTTPLYTWGVDERTALYRVLHLPAGSPAPRTRDGVFDHNAYSDLGFIVLGEVIARAMGTTFREAAAAYLARHADEHLAFAVPGGAAVAPMDHCGWRERDLVGEVHDRNAASLGGVAPHAGLFGTASGVAAAVARLARPGPAFEELARLRSRGPAADAAAPAPDRGLGWEIASPGWSGGSLARGRMIGQIGSTGTGAWAHESGQIAILLTNCVTAVTTAQRAAVASLRRRFVELTTASSG